MTSDRGQGKLGDESLGKPPRAASPQGGESEVIQLRKVEVNNLKRIDLDLPRGKLIAICGVSGSGKTSLALDTLYAEGQRRYIESYSVYARQFLEKLDKPAAERISGLPPAIAVAAPRVAADRSSTVGTATEGIDYLRLLYARVGRLVCPSCHREVLRHTPQSVAAEIGRWPEATRFQIAFAAPAEGEMLPEWAARWRSQGFARGIVGEVTVDLSSAAESAASLSSNSDAGPAEHLVVVDRLVSGAAGSRLVDSLETAFAHGEGQCLLLADMPTETAADVVRLVDGRRYRRLAFSNQLRCTNCGLAFPEPAPRLFSFQSPLGACPECHGSGEAKAGDDDSVSHNGHAPPCPACRGDRLRPEALAMQLGGKNIAEVSRMTASEAAAFLGSLTWTEQERATAAVALVEISSRLAYLNDVGLSYLSLDRRLATLSSGEVRRAQLAGALSSSLVHLLYVLDEPTTGLHVADMPALVKAIGRLRDRGNTVVAVEHASPLLEAAELVVEIGPGAGERGGEISFLGDFREMFAPGASVTGEYLAGRKGVSAASPRPTDRGWLRLVGARGNNLKNIAIDFPLGVICAVTGVSGAGKSTLVVDTLYQALQAKLAGRPAAPACDELTIDGPLDDVMLLDRQPAARTPRSNPVTYIKAFDDIRAVFAESPEARLRCYSASHFSFNVDGGRCPTCQGDGRLAIDMQFLPDVYMTCPDCGGTRYRKEILAATYRGRNIAEVLAMTVREAFPFFRGQTRLQARLKKLIDVGLDYLRLGQPANTLSQGESQRLKIAAFLASAKRSRTLFVMEEPASGLHFSDVATMIDCFASLVGVGHSLLIIDHNLQLIEAADYVIDLGPGAAAEGGRVVCTGTPQAIAGCPESATGRALARMNRGA